MADPVSVSTITSQRITFFVPTVLRASKGRLVCLACLARRGRACLDPDSLIQICDFNELYGILYGKYENSNKSSFKCYFPMQLNRPNAGHGRGFCCFA